MGSSGQLDSRVSFLIDWLVATLLKLHEHKISPSLVQMIVDRLEQYAGTPDALGSEMVRTGLSLKAEWARDEGRFDGALWLLERLASLTRPDDSRYYLEIAGIVRVLIDKGEYGSAWDLMGRSAMTAMDDEGVPSWNACDMLAIGRFGDLAESVKSTVFMEALGRYESRFLADKNLGLADLWRREPRKALELLLGYSPHPRSGPGPKPADREEGDSDLPDAPEVTG
jgi:hypothetical protein